MVQSRLHPFERMLLVFNQLFQDSKLKLIRMQFLALGLCQLTNKFDLWYCRRTWSFNVSKFESGFKSFHISSGDRRKNFQGTFWIRHVNDKITVTVYHSCITWQVWSIGISKVSASFLSASESKACGLEIFREVGKLCFMSFWSSYLILSKENVIDLDDQSTNYPPDFFESVRLIKVIDIQESPRKTFIVTFPIRHVNDKVTDVVYHDRF